MQSKLPNAGTTIFTLINQLALEHNAINLGQGFPDFGMDATLIELVHKAMLNGHNQYVHANGLPALREVLAEKIKNLYNNPVHAGDEITITPGGTYALYCAFTAIIQPGDEVIIFEPAYDSYRPNIEINGGIVVPISLEYPTYTIDWEKVKHAITAKTKAIVINSPHNPSGSLLTHNDMLQLEALVENTDIFIISDEVYEHLIFDGKKHTSILAYPALFKKAFVSFSFGKVYNCTGWKMGYSVAPAVYMAEFRKVHQYNCFTCFAPVQHALAAYIPEKTYLHIGKIIQEKRDYFLKAMEQTQLKPLPSYGSYFQLYSYEGLSDAKEMDMAEMLIKDAGVATIPVSSFYSNKEEHQVLRFCFTKQEATLQEAALRISNFKF